VEFGGLLGLSTVLENTTRLIAPTLGGFLLQTFGTSAPGLLGGLILLWLSSFIYRSIINPPKMDNPPLIIEP
jgi:hypothetical protein